MAPGTGGWAAGPGFTPPGELDQLTRSKQGSGELPPALTPQSRTPATGRAQLPHCPGFLSLSLFRVSAGVGPQPPIGFSAGTTRSSRPCQIWQRLNSFQSAGPAPYGVICTCFGTSAASYERAGATCTRCVFFKWLLRKGLARFIFKSQNRMLDILR